MLLSNTLLLCAVVSFGSALSDLSFEDAIHSLNQRINQMEERILLLENRETSDLAQKVKGELLIEVQNAERRSQDDKHQLTAKIEEVEATSRSRESDVSRKLDELEQRTLKQKEEISERLSETEMTSSRSFDEVSGKLQIEANRFLMVENHLLVELRGVQRKSTEALQKIGSMEIEMLQIGEKISHIASQRDVEENIRNNTSSSAEILSSHINDTLLFGVQSTQSTLSAKIRNLEHSLSKFEKDCANVSCVSKLDESLQNLDETTKAELRSIRSDLYPRVERLEKRRDHREDITRINTMLRNHTYEIGSMSTRLLQFKSRCSRPPSVEYGHPVTSGPGRSGRNHGDVVTFDCRDDKILVGSGEMVCRYGEWMGYLPQCVDPVCSPPCENGGKCTKGNVCICAPLFSGERCQDVNYSQCGIDLKNLGVNISHIDGTDIKVAPKWPWMAALYKKEKRNTSEESFLCGGSIIHRHFVLTAGHCMQDLNGLITKRGEILVKLGLTNLTDVTHRQVFQVRRIHIHPEYSTIRRHDYDIALLQLESPIRYNLFVRPVCLPPKEIPENSLFYEPGSVARTSGWGHRKVVRKNNPSRPELSHILKNIHLVIQPADICIESLRDDGIEDQFTDRMFCAAEGETFTCSGDAGGPAMQPQFSEKGYLNWTQVGILTWGLGCGLDKEYAFFSHLQKLMPWVEATIKDALEE